MIDLQMQTELASLEASINASIDALIPKRDQASPEDRYLYRYVTKKLEVALGAIHKAQDKIAEKTIDFSLEDK